MGHGTCMVTWSPMRWGRVQRSVMEATLAPWAVEIVGILGALVQERPTFHFEGCEVTKAAWLTAAASKALTAGREDRARPEQLA